MHGTLCDASASKKRFFFPFKFYFILSLGERLKGQELNTKGQEINGIKMHNVKETKKE